MNSSSPSAAILAFSDGVVFSGIGVGHAGLAVGEAVFNTAMCGYQEIISDPSYRRQIVVFTHPHIGNTGAVAADDESAHAVAGVVARKITAAPCNWRAQQSLPDYLAARQIPAIGGIDTRAVTAKLRDGGAAAVCIARGDNAQTRTDAVAAAAAFGGLAGTMLAAEAGQSRAPLWDEGLWRMPQNDYPTCDGARQVVVLDCGVKSAILRQLAARHCRVTVMPYDSDISQVRAQQPDGVLFSNGPGDPEPCAAAVELAKQLMAQQTPLLGICLGHQILATALGAKTIKMKFGHHGANHPVRDEQSGRVFITSQNHGFAVQTDSLPPGAQASHVSLFDGSLQGIVSEQPPLITFQGHPEASPGPHDAARVFDRFVDLIEERKKHA